jgi:sigma-B regulation protein RsbU (phosphoserine phosphatase)
MIQPKDLYRKLAALLDNIDKGRTKDDFLFSVILKLEHTFGKDLHISEGCLYVETLNQFILVGHCGRQKPADSEDIITLDAEIVHQVIINRSYIFDDLSFRINNQISVLNKYSIPAAFIVHSPDKRWIFVFNLESGWVHEEVEFCLNAVRTLLNYRLHSESMKNNIKQAALIQQSLLPNSPPQIDGYEIAGQSFPAEVVGGDFFDFSVFDDDVFSVAVGDASGHGLPAALLVRDVVTGLRMGVEKENKMAEAMQKLNRVIHRSTLSSHFISLFYGQIESNGNIIYVNAGHPPPFIIHNSQIRQLDSTGLILGFSSAISFYSASTSFERGAVLVLYSDGLLERLNGDDEEFGLSRLKTLIVQNQDSSAQVILDAIYQTIFTFGNETKWQDDVTIVVIKRMRL